MLPVLTAEQSRQQDQNTPIDPRVLVARAGRAVALAAVRLGAGYGTRTAVLCGPGNNGADGYIAAAELTRRGLWAEVLQLSEPVSNLAVWACERAQAAGVELLPWGSAGRSADLCIDALFGGGFRGGLPDVSAWGDVERRLAVDVPSGLSATTGQAAPGTLRADTTVTFQGLRVGHLFGSGPDRCGQVEVADIGLAEIEPEMWLCETDDAPLPSRQRQAHKWSAGSVLVVGGSAGLDGAATLTARAALLAGAGAVMIACPPTVEAKVRAPEIMTRSVGTGAFFTTDCAGEVLRLAERFDVMVLGPGLGETPETKGFVGKVLAGGEGPVLVDADGLNALDDPGQLTRSASTVITPHAGEFSRLTGAEASFPAATRLAAHTGAVVLLKGAPTFVAGAQNWVVNQGGPELATIGTGDILAGMIGAWWAGGLDGETAARSAAFWHGRAAAQLQSQRTVTADALAEQVAVTTRRTYGGGA